MSSFLLIFLLLRLSSSSVNVAEINYLITFYQNLNGPDWSFTDTWDISATTAQVTTLEEAEEVYDDLASGDGLKWDSDDRLEALNLTNMGLDGVVPDGIDALSELVTLCLTDNSITGLPDLGNFSQLSSIDVSFNSLTSLTGTFPSTLTSLYLQNNSISEDIGDFFARFDNLATLVSLNLDSNKFSGDITGENLSTSNLVTLKLSDNNIEGALSNVKSSWSEIDVSNNFLSGDFPSNLVGVSEANMHCNMFNCDSLADDWSNYNITECFCSTAGQYAQLNDSVISCATCPDGTMANKWVRFDFWPDVEDYDCAYATDGCVNCMFPDNCKEGACQTGSEGPTCERCSDGYRMTAGKCRECLESQVPIAALALLLIISVIVGYGIFLTGLNPLAATMIKQLMSYLQMYYLTMDIRTGWGTYLSELGDVYKLSMMNTQAFDLDCLTDLSPLTLFYIDWASAAIWPIIATIVVLGVDKGLSEKIRVLEKNQGVEDQVRTAESLHLRSKQTGMRRIWTMFMLIAFVPVGALSVRFYSCDNWVSLQTVTVKYTDNVSEIIDNQWFYDNSVDCYDYAFQGLAFVATMLCVGVFGVVVFLLLLIFRIWRFDLEDKQSDMFGGLYESFNPRGMFCEPILLLRKFLMILLTQVTYIAGQYSAGAITVMSFLWLIFIIVRRPYIKATLVEGQLPFLANWCNIFEIAATLLLTLTQVMAFVDAIVGIGTTVAEALDITLFVLHVLLVIVWMSGFVLVIIKYTKSGIKERRSRRSLRSQTRSTRGAVLLNNNARVTPEAEYAAADEEEGEVVEDAPEEEKPTMAEERF